MKPVLYLLPGLMCDEAVWRHQVREFQGLADVRTPVFRGLRSLPDMAAQVLRTAPRRFSLAGHSMGGRVALEIYRQAGERVERIALLDTGVHPVAPGEDEKRSAFLETGRSEGMEALAKAWIPFMVHPDRVRDPYLVEEIRSMVLRNSLRDVEGQVEALLKRPDARALLPTMDCPALVACGRQDAWAALAQHEEMARLIPGSTLAIVEDCGHMAPMERPREVTHLLAEWLN